jgi:hypothetical protein
MYILKRIYGRKLKLPVIENNVVEILFPIKPAIPHAESTAP